MKQIIFKKGSPQLSQIPSPKIGANEILVQLQASCLSPGTEMSGLEGSSVGLFQTIANKPQKILKAFQILRSHGLATVLTEIGNKKYEQFATGYSGSGIVVEIGSLVHGFSVGDRVACAGGQYVYHAEFIRVTPHLCVRIPAHLDFKFAATVALGSIALQGVRRAQPTLGETFVVLGLGTIGQLTSQILAINGCRVIGVDIDQSRIDKASLAGMQHGLLSGSEQLHSISQMTNGNGADGVIITAASSSDEIISSAFQMCRKKGRVVLVGDVGLHLKRDDFYIKEVDFLISTSYGPGRYDPLYEEKGLDYPIGYVRWTEKRNMEEFIRLLSEGRIKLDPLKPIIFPIEQAEMAYASLKSNEKPLVIFLTYPKSLEAVSTLKTRIDIKPCPLACKNKIRIALIGTGNFAKSHHLPNLMDLKKYFHLRALVNRTGHLAKSLSEQYQADYASTNVEDVLHDSEVDAVLIATRHNLHGSIALAALKAGKHVFVEKPTVLDRQELKKLQEFYDFKKKKEPQTGKPILLTGYNRRFSRSGYVLKTLLSKSSGPFLINYRVNAGHIPKENWVHGSEGGGRNLGEACHIYDFFVYLINEKVLSYSAHCIKDQKYLNKRNENFVATFDFADGSTANLIYTSLGNKNVPKERLELYCDGKVAILDDYKKLTITGQTQTNIIPKIQDKGFKNILISFAEGIKAGAWPIPWWQQIESIEMALNIEDAIKK